MLTVSFMLLLSIWLALSRYGAVKLGRDDTLFSLVDGVVKFERMRARNVVSVYPTE